MDESDDKSIPPTKRGRPAGWKPAEESVPVYTRLPTSQYDRIIRLAAKRDESVSSLIRQLLILRLP